MRTQVCSCVHEPLPRNPNFYFFVLLLLSYVVLFSFFLCFYASKISVSHVCLFICYHMFRLGFLVLMSCHSFTCPCINAIGAMLLKGKWRSCIGMNMHLMMYVFWMFVLCPIVCFIWFYNCHDALLPCLGCCLVLRCIGFHMLGFLICV